MGGPIKTTYSTDGKDEHGSLLIATGRGLWLKVRAWCGVVWCGADIKARRGEVGGWVQAA